MSVEISSRLSQVAQKILFLDGDQFSLQDYPMYEAVYDGRYKRTVLCCGRQVAKSTSLANFIIAESVCIPHFHSYYVSPSKEQTITFSNTRLRKTIAYSPLVNKYFQSPEHSDRVLSVSYTNGSENAFTYAQDDADRARGFSADRCLYDEVQDMLFDNVIPVINACMKNSDYRFETYAGTPKTMEASIQHLWEMSTQSEWVTKCDGCGKYNAVMSEKSIGKFGPVCLHCQKVLNTRLGFWHDMRKQEPGGSTLMKGFHIPQPIMPRNIPRCCPGDEAAAQGRWDDIIHDMETISSANFRNEVLGISDSIGKRLLSLDELKALCGARNISSVREPDTMRGIPFCVAGVDWTGGGSKGKSRTVLWVWGWCPAELRLKTMYFRIYPNNNAVVDVEDIIRVCNDYQVSMVVGDAGEGNLPNSMLKNALGQHRVMAAQYGANKRPIYWNDEDRWMLDRTTVIDNFMMFLKRKYPIKPEYPPYMQVKEAIEDVLHEYEDVTSAGKKVWQHAPDLADDALHAQIFAWIAFKLVMNDLLFYQ